MFGIVLIVVGILLFFNRILILNYQENIIGNNKPALRRKAREFRLIIMSIILFVMGLIMLLKK